MKKQCILIWLVIAGLICILTGCEEPPVPSPETYSITFVGGDGEGVAPVMESAEAGAQVTLPQNTFTKENYVFDGWVFEQVTYAAGQTFVMPASNVVFTAAWKPVSPAVGIPAFSQATYSYDRIGGHDIELPLDLAGANLYFVEIDGTLYSDEIAGYDETKQCLYIVESFAITLADGDHTIIAVTDADGSQPASCTLTVEQSIQTAFDTVVLKQFTYGKDSDVRFSVQYNGVTVDKVLMGDIVLDPNFYEIGEDYIAIKENLLNRCSGKTAFTLYLSNYDFYEFSVATNVIFFTDYDTVTIHNETLSDGGQNPLYQRTSSIAITDGLAGMDGKVLRITPDTHAFDDAYLTLRAESFPCTWYNAGFTDSYYIISFDYLTTDTTPSGVLSYKSITTSWNNDLLFGAENDGVLHHFQTLATAEEIGGGVYIRALFADGGSVYIDNFKIAALDALPTLTTGENYEGTGDYILTFDPKGFEWVVKIDGTEVNSSYDEQNHTLTFSESVMQPLGEGMHTVTVETAIGTFSAQFGFYAPKLAELSETYRYVTEGSGDVKLAGQFDTTLTVTSLTRKGGLDDDNAFAAAVSMNAAYITIEADGLVISEALIKQVYGVMTYKVTLSCGVDFTFSLESNKVLYSDYEETTWAYLPENPENCGISQDTGMLSIENGKLKYEPGKATLGHSANGAPDNAAITFSIKGQNDFWYQIALPDIPGAAFEVSFDYEIVLNGQTSSAYAVYMYDTTGEDNGSVGFYYVYLDPSETHYSKTFTATTLPIFKLNCAATEEIPFDSIRQTYMYIDNFSIRVVVPEQNQDNYLTELTKDIVAGEGDVKLAGKFDTSLSVKSLTRRSSEQHDNAYAAEAEMSASYVTLQTDGLLLAQALVDQAYGTMTYTLTLSDETVIQFTLNSNRIIYSNYEETTWAYLPENPENCGISQDTGMLSIENGKLKYEPGKATLGHSANGAPDNAAITFSIKGQNDFWYQIALPDIPGAAFEVSFDYEIVLNGQTSSAYAVYMYDTTGEDNGSVGFYYVYLDPSETHYSKTFTATTLPIFKLNCAATEEIPFDSIRQTYMYIDNFTIRVVVPEQNQENDLALLTEAVVLKKSVTNVSQKTTSTPVNYEVTGGRIAFDFSSASDERAFIGYSEFETLPWVDSGKLFFWTLAEQKIVLKEKVYSDVDISVDIGTINQHGKFNAGIFVQASKVNGRRDSGTCWLVSLERGADQETYWLKLPRFENNVWLGEKTVVSGLVLPMNLVNMRVVVKNGTLFAFLNHSETPYITYDIGTEAGNVGVRCDYSPNWLDNLTIIGDANTEYDTLMLAELVAAASEIDQMKLTEQSRLQLSNAFITAQNLLATPYSQYRIDDAVSALAFALDNLIYAHSYDELRSLVAQAQAIENPDGMRYTANSWASMQTVLAYASILSEHSGEEEISYWAQRLEHRMDQLILL